MEQKTKKIRIKTNFAGSNFELDVPLQYRVKDILTSILLEFNKDLELTELSEELEIFINEKEIWFYPEKIETILREGDLLEVYVTPLGGG